MGTLREEFLFNVLKGLYLPIDKLLIAGSAPLYFADILEESALHELDIVICDKNVWRQACDRFGGAERLTTNGFKGHRIVVKVSEGGLEEIEFTDSWPMAGRPLAQIFKDSTVRPIGGGQIHCLSLRDVVVTKRVLDRGKDHAHLEAVRKFIEANNDVPLSTKESARQGFAVDVSRILP